MGLHYTAIASRMMSCIFTLVPWHVVANENTFNVLSIFPLLQVNLVLIIHRLCFPVGLTAFLLELYQIRNERNLVGKSRTYLYKFSIAEKMQYFFGSHCYKYAKSPNHRCVEDHNAVHRLSLNKS